MSSLCCPVIHDQALLSCYPCPVSAVLLSMTRLCCPVIHDQALLSCYPCPISAVLLSMTRLICPVVDNLGLCSVADNLGLYPVAGCCSGSGPRQLRSSGLAPVSRFHSSVPLYHPSPSLIGLFASVDVKQQSESAVVDNTGHWTLPRC